jgi:CRP-like cAMP-binding protein
MIDAVRAFAAPLGNVFVDAFSMEVRDWFAERARETFVARGTILKNRGEHSAFVYFPVDAVLVTWQMFAERHPTCTQIAGRLNASAYAEAIEREAGDAWTEVLCSGRAWRLPWDSLAQGSRHGIAALLDAMARLGGATLAVATRRIFCTAEHNVDRRIASTLLYLCEQRGYDEISVTHETLSAVVAIRRPTLSQTLAAFARKGWLRSTHGEVSILDRAALEGAACSCFSFERDSLLRAARR